LNGKSKERQQLAETAIPLSARLPVIAARGGEDLALLRNAGVSAHRRRPFGTIKAALGKAFP
jgi:hypothetical protein